MNKQELRSLIREEIKKTLKEALDTNNPKDIISYLGDDKPGIYVFAGDQADDVRVYNTAKLKPLFYTPKLNTNVSNLIKSMETKYPKFKEFTIVDFNKSGIMDVRVS